MRKLKLLSTLLISCFAGTALAQDGDGLSCHVGYESAFLPYTDQDPETSEVDVKADQVQLQPGGTSIFTGDVDINRAGQELSANRATYNRNTGDLTANGEVRLRDSEIIIDSEQAEWSLESDEGRMLDAEYRLRETHARGEASHVLRQGRSKTNLKNATYTTCPEGSNAWQLKADKVRLNHETAVGEAEDVVIRVGNVPIFYTPYINFPLNDERKSGFLIPSFGSSDETGFDLITPYYWNIAPNLDATLAPRYMSDRGLMLGGEFRYLYGWGEGQFEAQYLNSDDHRGSSDDINPFYQEDRELFSWQHKTKGFENWYAKVDYNFVSDGYFFEDFGSSLSSSSRTHLRRLLETGYATDAWDFKARLQGYQALRDVRKQYKRLPQLLLTGYLPDQAYGLTYEIEGEYVEFDHDDRVDGQRMRFESAVSRPMGTAGYFVTPRVAINHTQYNLTNDTTNTYDDNASTTLPILSLDSGLFFDRAFQLGDSNYIQTLEPRAFYLYIPERDQSDIPDFDTRLSTFNMIRLFSYDRFIGGDRVGDANQLSLALTTRFINEETGKERLRLTVGQIQYFEDRTVTLPSGTAETDSDSDLIAEAVAYIHDEWALTAESQWDTGDKQSNMSAVGVRYRGESGTILNVSHRYRRENVVNNPGDGLETVDISTQLPLGDRWQFYGRWFRDLEESRTLEGLAGLQYDSCCWATRLVVRNYINDVDDDDRNMAIYLQFELKGLGNFGKKSDSLLESSIRGFDAH
jgi:LPS-assembly protein